LVDKELKFIFTKMDVLQYLIKLVEDQREVGVPGLGTLYKKKAPGRYDVNIHSFIPPAIVLQFKQEVTEAELFENYLSSVRNISIDSAHYFIRQFSEDLNKALNTDQKASLGSLGTLILEDGKIYLSPVEATASSIEFFGLPQIKDFERFKKQNDIEVPGVSNLNDQIYPDQPQSEASELEAILNENALEEENPGIQPSSTNVEAYEMATSTSMETAKNAIPLYLKILLAGLVVLVACFVFYFLYPNTINNFNGSHQQKQATAIEPNAQQGNTIPFPDTSEPDSTAADKLATDTVNRVDSSFKAEQSLVPAKAHDSTQVTYEIIGSSPYRLKEAEQFIHNMKVKHGILAKIVSQKKGKKIKVSVATLKTKQQAEMQKPILIKKLGIKGLYTYTNIHKPE
jgi:hypothetical protein